MNPPSPDYRPPTPPPSGQHIRWEFWSEAWAMMQSNMPAYLVAGLFVAVFTWGITFASLVETFTSPGAGDGSMIPSAFDIAGIMVSQLTLAGFYRMSIKHVRQGYARLSDFFVWWDVFPSVLVIAVVESIAVYTGTLCCCVPGLVLSGLFLFAFPLAVDQGLGPIAAIKESFRILWPRVWLVMLFVLLVNIVAGGGVFGLGVGLIFTCPFSYLGVTLAYRDLVITGPTQQQFPDSYPSAPISDPGA